MSACRSLTAKFVSFIGPSGCGKTTMLRVIADLQQPTAGTLLVNGHERGTGASRAQIRLRVPGAGLVPVADDREEPEAAAGGHGVFPIASSGGERRAIWRLVNLTGFERKFPWQLSGGMQQRVSIARGACRSNPALLLMDEPFGALDEIVRDHLNEQLLQLWDKTGKTVRVRNPLDSRSVCSCRARLW